MNRLTRALILLLSISPLWATPGVAQPLPPAQDPDVQEDVAAIRARMGFMVGEWRIDAKIRTPNGYLVGSGTMDARFDVDGTTFLADMDTRFQGFAVTGTTRRVYNPARKLWDVDWLTGNASSVLGIEGRFSDGHFIEINYGTDGAGPFIGRLVVSEITDDHFVVRKDRLYDDGTLMPEVWLYEATRTGGEPQR